MESRFNVKDRVRVSEESLPGYPETMRLGWILGVMEDDGDVSYEVAVSFPNTKGSTGAARRPDRAGCSYAVGGTGALYPTRS